MYLYTQVGPSNLRRLSKLSHKGDSGIHKSSPNSGIF